MASNVSSDLVWEITRSNNAYLVKRKDGGGVQFSRDPLNLVNKNSRKHAGFVNEKAVGVCPADRGGITLISKKTKNHNRPVENKSETTFAGHRSGPKVYKSVVSAIAKQGYRPDLRQEVVARASALRRTSKPVKADFDDKPRGAKARRDG